MQRTSLQRTLYMHVFEHVFAAHCIHFNVSSFICRSLSDLNRKMDDDYKREIDEIYRRLSAKNQEKLADLLTSQQEEEEELRERSKDLPKKV